MIESYIKIFDNEKPRVHLLAPDKISDSVFINLFIKEKGK